MLARLVHRHATDPRIAQWLDDVETDGDLIADELTVANLREIRRDHERAVRVPESLIAEQSETASRALEVWKVARRDDDFASFRPWLTRLLELANRRAECLGIPAGGEAYDVLLDDFEPGVTSEQLLAIFGPLRAGLTPLIRAIAESRERPREDVHRVRVSTDAQRAFHLEVVEALGYDLRAGRLDVSTHPFTDGIAPGDTRITTRFGETGFADALGSTIHEAGHALYEQGLPKAGRHGQPVAEAAGLGIHESQSRLWENQVGRSRQFWSWALPIASRHFGGALDGFSLDDVYGAMNSVKAGLIRVEADEATYNLHVMIRFDLERAMVRGDLAVADLPAAWADRIRSDLGLDVPGDREGCLQDIHWAMGSFGYFPTYTLGSLYAAQMWVAIREDLRTIDEDLESGRFGGLLAWLRRNVHVHGRRYRAPELCRRLTGREISPEPLLDYLRTKLGPLYGLE
jgi:carboxypeptidase Taq